MKISQNDTKCSNSVGGGGADRRGFTGKQRRSACHQNPEVLGLGVLAFLMSLIALAIAGQPDKWLVLGACLTFSLSLSGIRWQDRTNTSRRADNQGVEPLDDPSS